LCVRLWLQCAQVRVASVWCVFVTWWGTARNDRTSRLASHTFEQLARCGLQITTITRLCRPWRHSSD
jgi:hypothetical protein